MAALEDIMWGIKVLYIDYSIANIGLLFVDLSRESLSRGTLNTIVSVIKHELPFVWRVDLPTNLGSGRLRISLRANSDAPYAYLTEFRKQVIEELLKPVYSRYVLARAYAVYRDDAYVQTDVCIYLVYGPLFGVTDVERCGDDAYPRVLL